MCVFECNSGSSPYSITAYVQFWMQLMICIIISYFNMLKWQLISRMRQFNINSIQLTYSIHCHRNAGFIGGWHISVYLLRISWRLWQNCLSTNGHCLSFSLRVRQTGSFVCGLNWNAGTETMGSACCRDLSKNPFLG